MESGTIEHQETREEVEARVAAEERGEDVATNAEPGGYDEAEGEAEEDDGREPLRLEIEGDGQLTLTVGGAKPETSTVKLQGGSMDVAGGDFDKGQEVKFVIHGVVSSVEFVDSRNQYGDLSGTERRHKVRMLRVERLRD